jgi:hypothetical protein
MVQNLEHCCYFEVFFFILDGIFEYDHKMLNLAATPRSWYTTKWFLSWSKTKQTKVPKTVICHLPG